MSKKWYVVHAYSGFEKTVQRTLTERIARAGMQEQFGRVLVPVEEVVESCIRAGWATDAAKIRRKDQKLDQIEARVPNVRSFSFADLAKESVCAELYEYCTGQAHDHAHWARLDQEKQPSRTNW